MKKILHVSHRSPDIDSIASLVWGQHVFGGDILIPDNKLLYSTEKVLKDFKIRYIKQINKSYDYTFIYDTCSKEDVYIFTEKYVIFDHHLKRDESFYNGAIKRFDKANSANAINLYELSKKWNIQLPEKIMFLFAIAIYSDTAMLKTARKEQLLYIAELMKNHTIGEIENYACPHRFNEKFLQKVSSLKLKSGVLYGEINDGDEFYGIVDSIFRVMEAKVLCCKMKDKNVMKFYCNKKDYQWLIQKILKPFSETYNVKYAHTNLYGDIDFESIIKFIEENQQI